MNTLTELNPWNLLDTLLDTNNRVFRNVCTRAAGRFPPVNVYLDDNATIIDVELPGKAAKDVDLTLESQAVVIADKPADTAIYTLDGRRVQTVTRPGIYIQNKKKIIIR